ncbi:hypothetical protein OE88DRAFT_1303652 [Heliocybe sulcata]|uniref:Mixed lineage kinase domain-containing protein n=1 Tax=Heliocybe sulcata TaxID=5364 RepID=A0A5C3N6I6_9AGAM|nr:hypothetical protein OE88DRAFT_1303652 [Heliocybe sulcata]
MPQFKLLRRRPETHAPAASHADVRPSVEPDRKSRSKRSAALKAASLALIVLETTAGDTNIPGLKAAVSIGKKIVDMAEKAKSNKEDCHSIAEAIYMLIEKLVNTTQGRTSADVDDLLVKDIKQFSSDLEIIQITLRKASSRKLWKRMVTAGDDKRMISDCKQKLQASSDAFKVSTQTVIRTETHGIRLTAGVIMRNQETIAAQRAQLAQVQDLIAKTLLEGQAVGLRSDLLFFFFGRTGCRAECHDHGHAMLM